MCSFFGRLAGRSAVGNFFIGPLSAPLALDSLSAGGPSIGRAVHRLAFFHHLSPLRVSGPGVFGCCCSFHWVRRQIAAMLLSCLLMPYRVWAPFWIEGLLDRSLFCSTFCEPAWHGN